MTDRSGMFYDQPPNTEEKKPDVSPKIGNQEQTPQEDYAQEPDPVSESVEHDVGNIIDLPSKGLLGYPGSISHREIMAGDEEILKSATNKNAGRTMNRVVKSICNNADFFDDMYVGDRDFIVFWIWANTYDNIKQFEVTCRHCGATEDAEVDMFKLPENPIKEDELMTRFPLELSKTGQTIYIRMLTVRDENNAEKFLADNPKEKYNMETVMMCLALEFGRPMSTKDRVEFLKNNVTAKEFGVIKEYHRFFEFGIDTSYTHVCSECEGVTQGQIPFRPEEFITPKVRTDFEQLLRDKQSSRG